MIKKQTTKDLIVESFRQLAGKMAVNKITVQDIVDNCELSSATFYRHFKDKYDLIAYEHILTTMPITNQVGVDGYTFDQAFVDGPKVLYENREYLLNLFNNTEGKEAFIRQMAEIHIENYKGIYLRLSKEKTISKDVELQIRIYSYGTVQLMCEWISGNIKATAEEIRPPFFRYSSVSTQM